MTMGREGEEKEKGKEGKRKDSRRFHDAETHRLIVSLKVTMTDLYLPLLG